jgi:hypothetical protein
MLDQKIGRIVEGFAEIDFLKYEKMQNTKTGEIARITKWLDDLIVVIDTVEGLQYHNIEFVSDWEFVQ